MELNRITNTLSEEEKAAARNMADVPHLILAEACADFGKTQLDF